MAVVNQKTDEAVSSRTRARSTQLRFLDDKESAFHKLNDEKILQSPVLSPTSKKQMKRAMKGKMEVPVLDFGATAQNSNPNKRESADDKGLNWAANDKPVDPVALRPARRTARRRNLPLSQPDLNSKFTFYYQSKYCKDCKKMDQFLANGNIPLPQNTRISQETPLVLSEIMHMARRVRQVVICSKYKSVKRIDINGSEDPPSSVLERLLLTKDCRVKTPCFVVGKRLIVGYNESVLRECLFFGNMSPQRRKRTPAFKRTVSSLKNRMDGKR
eukprot:CAMPEP_0119129982 /NCGR_PEP_ID=MMETSP1310-20130426/7503_1 /TAXON_ID=464262 /ORGANISM="Genus nov. species nov., Strain RCC2339" /LENGTH=271 /DNA_ID=CAMNT_0007120445 /DNA_START=168 /DNA_END=983 /DNA_ORIENTATION=+